MAWQVATPTSLECTVVIMFLFLSNLVFGSPPSDDAGRQEALAQSYDRYDWTFPKVDDIEVHALMDRLQQPNPPILVDVRPQEERNVSMLPGAISLDTYEADPDAYEGRQVVTYCTVGVRSGYAANRLRKKGVDVVNFRGSILAWTHADGPLVTPSGDPTRQVHVYSPRWDFAATDYESVTTDRNGVVQPVE